MPLPATHDSHALTQQQLDRLQSEDSYLRGTAALDILNQAVKKTGVVIPAEHIWAEQEPEIARKAILSVFPLIGGMPAFALWASQNPTDYYKIFAKIAPTENVVTGGGNTVVITQVPSSPLDDIDIVEAEVRSKPSKA